MNTNIDLFWSTPVKEGQSFDEWRNAEICTTEFHKLPMFSHTRLEHNVRLYTYQNLDTSPIPSEFEIMDANLYYPAEMAYTVMEAGHKIAHISDLVRLKAALERNGVVLDMDAVCINEFPDVPCFTSTMPARTTGGVAIQWGKSHPPFKIYNGSWDGKALSAFPIKVHECIRPEVEALIDKIADTLSKPPSTNTKAWNYIMWTLKDIANHNPAVMVMQPIHFCPIPAWRGPGNCYSLDAKSKFDGNSSLFGYNIPSAERIFEETYAVQHFFESSFKGADFTDENFWSTVKEGSLLYKECELIFGDIWYDMNVETINTIEEW